MSRIRTLALAALTAALFGCLRAAPEPVPAVQPDTIVVVDGEPMNSQPGAAVVAPMPREVPPRLPVAPMPHEPGERDLTNEDIGLDRNIELALPEIERLDRQVIDAPGIDPLGIPNPPAVDLSIPGLGLGQPGIDNPPAKGAGGAFAGRRGATKAKLLKQHGGTSDTEKAVAAGLAWLAKQQKADGSWQFDGSAKDETAAATGFAVLAFLGAGETHKDAKGKYRTNVLKGLQFLMKSVPTTGANAGKFANSKTMYGQGIVSLALVEAYGMTKDVTLRLYAQAAVNFIQRSQARNGSWGYAPGNNGDTSILGWQMQALFVAKQAGLVVDDRVIKSALKFLDSVATGEKKAAYGYSSDAGARPGTSLTAIGLWSRAHFDDWDSEHPGMKEGVGGLLKRPPAKNQLNTYHLHYATMVIKDAGGGDWLMWNEGPKAANGTRKGGLRDVLVQAQITDGDNAGSWNPDIAYIGKECGRLGTTALCIINLEVYYRYVEAEKKDAKKK